MTIIIPEPCLTWNQVLSKATFHWRKKAQLFELWKEFVAFGIYTSENKPQLPFENKVVLEFVARYKDKRRRDPDGLCLKPIIDALVDYRVITDDSYKEINFIKQKVESNCEKNELIINIYEE